MAPKHATRSNETFSRLIGVYSDQSDDAAVEEFVIPEDFSSLSDADLHALHEQAVSNFDVMYGDGSGLSDEDLSALSALTEGIESLSTEVAARKAAADERAEQAAALSQRIHSVVEEAPVVDETTEEGEAEEVVEETTDEADTEAPAAVTASSPRREVRVPVNRRTSMPPASDTPRTIQDVLRAAGDGTGYAPGAGIDWAGAGRIVDRRLQGFNQSQYEIAAQRGQHLRQQFSVATVEKSHPKDLRIVSSDPEHIESVIRRATSESRLPGNSLTASGGWCAPSEVVYDLLEVESRDGLFDLPTFGINRGGIKRTLGPDFKDLFAEDIGWHVTEAQDIAGDYDGTGTANTKPCYRIECTDFEEFRLEIDGICVTAGLLMQRGYPELIARTIRGILIAHEHKMAARRLSTMAVGSDAVTMPTSASGGAAAPLLSAIELQVEHMRYIRRLARSTTMEAVFPFWTHGAVRADLAQRLGVDLLDVSNARINGWFTERGIAPQFVYNWQDLVGDSDAVTGWPESVKFLLYPAGTWVGAGGDIISIDTLYDSVLLGKNDYTALFTEESWLVLKNGFDSRLVEVPLCPNGVTHTGAVIACDPDAAVGVPPVNTP